MKIFDHLDKIHEPFKSAVITIGNFDGVHIGHQALFHEVIETAETVGGTSIAMTFEPHPIRVLKQNGQPPQSGKTRATGLQHEPRLMVSIDYHTDGLDSKQSAYALRATAGPGEAT